MRFVCYKSDLRGHSTLYKATRVTSVFYAYRQQLHLYAVKEDKVYPAWSHIECTSPWLLLTFLGGVLDRAFI